MKRFSCLSLLLTGGVSVMLLAGCGTSRPASQSGYLAPQLASSELGRPSSVPTVMDPPASPLLDSVRVGQGAISRVEPASSAQLRVAEEPQKAVIEPGETKAPRRGLFGWGRRDTPSSEPAVVGLEEDPVEREAQKTPGGDAAVIEGRAGSKRGFLGGLFGPGAAAGEAVVESPVAASDVSAVAEPLSPQEQAQLDAEMARLSDSAQVTLRPGLLLDVKVMVAGKNQLEPDAVRVSEQNQIFLPLLGQVPVGGLTMEQLRDELTARYRRYFVNPEILVDFARGGFEEGISPWGYITVLGRVKNPGRIMIPATRDLTVSAAIQGAGGFDSSARINAIRVTRRNPETGELEQRTVNLNEVGEDGRVRDDFVLGMDDIVFVPEARF